jgi:putative sugar O-methyltransferase
VQGRAQLPLELALALDDLQTQSPLYRPSAFWEDAAKGIVTEICELGIERFRSFPLALKFFVPTFGPPGSGLARDEAERLRAAAREFGRKAQLVVEHSVDGRLAAQADYRVVAAADDPSRVPYLHRFSESSVGQPIEHFELDGRMFSRSSLHYLLGLVLLKKHIGAHVPRRILEIGGGFGTLGEILAQSGIDDLRYVDVDIPPISYIAQYYLSQVLGAERVATYAQTRERTAIAIDSLPTVSVLATWQIEKLVGSIDLFVNFISFQEMEPDIVRNYLSHVNRLEAAWLLLRNLREGQRVRTQHHYGVETPIRSDDYLEMLPGYELVERNVLPFGFETVDGFHSELLLLRRR